MNVKKEENITILDIIEVNYDISIKCSNHVNASSLINYSSFFYYHFIFIFCCVVLCAMTSFFFAN